MKDFHVVGKKWPAMVIKWPTLRVVFFFGAIVYIPMLKYLFTLLIELEIAPTFTLVEERNAKGVPNVAITFPNGHNDILLLDKFYANEEDRMIQGIKEIVKLNSSTGFLLKTVKNLKNRIG